MALRTLPGASSQRTSLAISSISRTPLALTARRGKRTPLPPRAIPAAARPADRRNSRRFNSRTTSHSSMISTPVRRVTSSSRGAQWFQVPHAFSILVRSVGSPLSVTSAELRLRTQEWFERSQPILPEQGPHVPAQSPEGLFIVAVVVASNPYLAVHQREQGAVDERFTRVPGMGRGRRGFEKPDHSVTEYPCDRVPRR